MRYIVFILALIATSAQGRSFEPVKVKTLSLEIKDIGPNKRDPYFDNNEENWGYKMNLLWDVRLFNFLFMDSDTYFETSNSVVRHIGWHYRNGAKVFDWLDLVHEHHSRHAADKERPVKFPVEDSYGIRINFIPKK